MKKIIGLAAAALCAVTLSVPAATTPAAAQSMSFGWGVNVGNGYWNGWNGRDRWDRWDRHHRPFRARSGVSINLGPIDLNVRARGGSGWSSHVQRCEDHYISYDRGTDMFLGYDGDYHRCRL